MDRYAQIREAFARAGQTPAADRAAVLAGLTPDVRAEVESLLAALESGDGTLGFLDAGEIGPGSDVGPYRLREELGRGGMGVVFRADRRDGEYVREVAVKIAAGRTPAGEAERRFIRERQILARLEHPNIVRMIDGGVVRGRRYVVMELVRGAPITEYARGRPLAEQLGLFRQLCGAVHYAHQKLILHRDLKPGNILVSADGAVKVLDFGIAQLVRGDDSTGQPEATATAANPLSLSCASPEQLRGEPLTLASDIYSLGALLYELVTGENPQWREGDTFAQVFERVVRDAPLPKAPSRMRSGIGRDLDAVIGKAMAREPAGRYGSAAELDADIASYLARQPVRAVAPSWRYAAAQFARRNRALTAVAALALVGAVAGSALYVRQAQREARRFAEARRLVRTVVFDIQPKLEATPATLPLRKTLAQETLRYLEGVSRDAGNDAGLLGEIGRAYQELAQVQGQANSANLGDAAGAAQSFLRAAEFAERAAKLAPGDYDVLLDAGKVRAAAAIFHLAGRRFPLALEHASAGTAYLERAAAMRPAERASREALALAVTTRSRLQHATGKLDEAVQGFERARAVYEELAARYPEHQAGVAQSCRQLIGLYSRTKRSQEALGSAARALEISRARLAAAPGDQSRQIEHAQDLAQTGEATMFAVDARSALPYLARATEMAAKLAAQDPVNVHVQSRYQIAIRAYAYGLGRAREFAQARQWRRRGEQVSLALIKGGHREPNDLLFAADLFYAGAAEESLGSRQAACAFYRRADAMMKQRPGKRSHVAGGDYAKDAREALPDKLKSCGG